MDPLQIDVQMMAAIDLDHSFFIQLALVLVLMAILNKLIFQPFLRSVELRESKTGDTRRDAAELEARAQTLKHEYREKLASARHDAAAKRQAVRIDAGAKKDTVVSDARESANAKLASARERANAQVGEAREALLGEVDDLSRLVVEKVLGRGV